MLNQTLDTAAAYSIMEVAGNAILSKTGNITVCYYMDNPEPYTLDREALHMRHSEFERALKTLPAGSYLHKQDVFLKRRYDPASHMTGKTFLQRAEMQHFTGRLYLEHFCILAFTLAGLESLEPAYNKNPLAYNEALTRKDQERLDRFLESVKSAVIVLKNLQDTTIRSMDEGELRQYIYHYVNGFTDGQELQHIRFADKLEIGDATGAYFSISDETYLPEQMPVFVTDDTLPKSNASLHMAPLEKLGLHLPYNHVYNQIIYCEGHDKLKDELEKRVILFGQHRRFAKDTLLTHEKLDNLQTEVLQEQVMLCRAHFSLMVWDQEPAEVAKAKEIVRETLKMRDIVFYEPKYEWLRDIFLGTVLGRCNKLNPAYYFLTDTAVACTLLVNYSVFRDDPAGALFCDRIFQKPLRKDIWDEGKRRIPARNGLIIASTGGGKSATAQDIVEHDIIDGTIPIVVEFGSSFKNLARLYPDISAHIDYDGKTPLGVNPFYIQDRAELTADKLKTLTILVLKFWREKEIKEDAKQSVSLTKILRDYYDHTQDGHSFPDFYNYVKKNYDTIIARQDIPPAYFDVGSFLHICSEFMPGGVYESVCKPAADGGGYEDKIRSKQFIVFELTRIKKDPFLVSVILAIIIDTVENKILFDRSKRGKLYLDEYGETAVMKDSFTGEDVHSTVAFFFQKFRKENGAIYAIIQTPDQLPKNNYTDGIFANAQLIFVLPTTETVYTSIINACKMKNEAHINLMKSIRNNFSGSRPYAEVFIRFGDLYATVVRLEFSKQKFFAFQTDGPDWQYLDKTYQETGNMETAIANLIKIKEHENSIL